MDVPTGAFALRLFRVDLNKNRFLNYEAITFPNNPRSGCDMMLRRAAVSGEIKEIEHGERLGVDVLDEGGDILETLGLTRQSFQYLRRKLKTRREPTQ